MSDNEKERSQIESTPVHEVSASSQEQGGRPGGLRGWYQHPVVQVCMLGFVAFMGPGLFNALNGLGGGGRVDQKTSANGNSALYATFSVTAFFAGSINNVLGPRLTLLIGSCGYSLYIGSYLATNLHDNAGWFIIFAGAILGICAGLLWTAQGSLMLAYPTEQDKGTYIAIFWGIFNLGGVVGGAVAFGQNYHSTGNSVGSSTYIGFLVLTCIGIFIPMLMTDPNKMYRSDGSKVTSTRHPSWKTEVYSLYLALRTDPAILLLFPLFLASNWFYTWQFNGFNFALFNIRTRALNSFIYWTTQIFGSLAMGQLLDLWFLTRRQRAFLGWGVLLVFVMVVHGWAYHYQKGYTRAIVADPSFHKMDWTDNGFAAYMWLYIFFALLDSMWQTAAYWMMGAMSNDPAKLAIFAGFYKSIQSAGAAGAWRADGVEIPYMNLFASTWALCAAGLIFALPMLYTRVKNHTDLEDEVIARMDDSGRIRDVSEVEKL
ncbi:hypothetical protein FRC04_010737 [Tulasnella sp. 424]|nr:hypothetical protein FRC04_010737 [Tulasnella sp. 424]KAG8969262.1 hypothetical protein FRC05_001121 [Tulasnella sp. 425]